MCGKSASPSSGAATRANDTMVKWLLVLVVGIVVISMLTPWLSKHGLGRLPGDITVRWRGRLVYLPITTTILLSLLLTLFGRLV